MNHRLYGPIFLTGLCLLQAQILLFREFLVLSHGNELALGGMLLIWLVGTGLGSIAGGRLFSHSPGTSASGFLPLAMAFLLLGSMAILRFCPFWFGYSLGEMLSLSSWTAIAIGALFPLCFISGILFPLFGQLAKKPPATWESILGVYWAEALGAAAGGILGLFLITWINGFQLALLINTGLAFSSFWVWLVHPEKSDGDKKGYISLFLALIFIVLALGVGQKLDQRSRAFQWQPFALKMIRETPFGNLALAEKGGQVVAFLNGIFQFSYPDPRKAEEKTHLPLLSHPQPRTILLIGGGLSGTLGEILKHPMIEKVEYVELDPDWVNGLDRFLPEVKTLIESNPKTRLLFGDGRRILKKKGNHYDLIFLDLPGPVSLQLSRFYSQEFFQTVKDHLNPGGILSLVLSGPADMIGSSQAKTLKSLYGTLQGVFPRTVFFPGEEISLLGFRNEPNPDISSTVILNRLAERSLKVDYLNPLHIQTILSPWRTAYFQTILHQEAAGEFNQDLRPVSFFNQLRSDLALHNPWLANGFKKAEVIPFSFWLGLMIFLWAALLVWFWFFPGTRSDLTVLTSIGVSGFSAMALEILILVLFQIGLGILYLEIGLLMAFFMLGLAGGAFLAGSPKRPFRPSRPVLVGVQGLISVFFLLLLSMTKVMGIWPEGFLKLFLYGSMTVSGGLCGTFYALCSRAYYDLGKGIGRTAGTLYGLDLLGASLASLGIPFVFLPLWGMPQTLFFLFLLNALTAILIAQSEPKIFEI